MKIDETTRALLKLVSDSGKSVSEKLANALGISRQAASARLRKAIIEGLIVKHGVGRGVEYTLAELRRVHQEYDRKGLREDVVWSSLFAPLVRDLPDNVRDIWRYGFTEMVNNAIDHSGAHTISIWGVRNA